MEVLKSDQIKVLEDAIDRWGGPMQMVIAIEEMAELTKLLCKDYRGDVKLHHLEDLASEIADVLIMMEQLMMIFENKPMVVMVIKGKIERLKKRLNG